MKNVRPGSGEANFTKLVWENEPVHSSRLVDLAADAFGWTKSTTYTVLRRLCQKGVIKNENSMVTSCISKNDYLAQQSQLFVEENFGGSIPMLLVAFRKKRI